MDKHCETCTCGAAVPNTAAANVLTIPTLATNAAAAVPPPVVYTLTFNGGANG